MINRRTLIRSMFGLGGVAMVAVAGGSSPALSSGRLLPVEWCKGKVIEWNPITLENLIEVDGVLMRNLSVQGVGEATTIRIGSVVGLIVVGGTYAVLGRLVIPGTPDAADAVSLLNSQIISAFVLTDESTTSTTYTDLTTIGPQVDVVVGPSGRILIIATAQCNGNTIFAPQAQGDNRFNVAFSGANTRSPNDTVDPLLGIFQMIDRDFVDDSQHSRAVSVTAQAVFSGLNPGLTTVTMKYRNVFGAVNSSEFSRRGLTVIKL